MMTVSIALIGNLSKISAFTTSSTIKASEAQQQDQVFLHFCYSVTLLGGQNRSVYGSNVDSRKQYPYVLSNEHEKPMGAQ